MPRLAFIEYCKKHDITVKMSETQYHVNVLCGKKQETVHYPCSFLISEPLMYDILEELVMYSTQVLNYSNKKSLQARENDLDAFVDWLEDLDEFSLGSALQEWRECHKTARALHKILGRHLEILDQLR